MQILSQQLVALEHTKTYACTFPPRINNVYLSLLFFGKCLYVVIWTQI